MGRRSNLFESVVFENRATLYYAPDDSFECLVESGDWFAACDGSIEKFSYMPFPSFHATSKTAMTCKREKRRNTWYWYAYAKIDGKTRKRYIGKTDNMTQARLTEIYAMLVNP